MDYTISTDSKSLPLFLSTLIDQDLKENLLAKERTPDWSPSKNSDGSVKHLSIDTDKNSPLFKMREEKIETTTQGTKLQLRALIYKNFALQSKQKGTNICQVNHSRLISANHLL